MTTNYTLTTGATNGTITLNPPGGIYSSGTVVTVTATPNTGYTFGSWSGDLSGSGNPATITINGNKSVTANFSVLTPGSKQRAVRREQCQQHGAIRPGAISNRLQSYGYTVQMVSDAMSTTADATGKESDHHLLDSHFRAASTRNSATLPCRYQLGIRCGRTTRVHRPAVTLHDHLADANQPHQFGASAGRGAVCRGSGSGHPGRHFLLGNPAAVRSSSPA